MMKRTIVTLYLIISILLPALAQLSRVHDKYEARAVWLTTIGGIDWPHCYAQDEQTIGKQQQELISILDKLQLAGINQVLLQTRIRATTIYPSAYEPWDGCLSGVPGKSPGYDALRFAIDECHRRGMELHAWIVSIPVGKWNGAGCKRLRKQHPDLLKKIGEDGFMNPENPKTGVYLANICEEIVRNYDVDGIHLDYIRYPDTWKIKVPVERGRKYITDIVRHINRRVKPIKPYVKFSCSPIGKFDDLTRYHSYGWNANKRVCQDAQGWLRDGLMDQLFPMMYFQGKHFYPFAIDWSENTYGRIVTPGLGIYCLSEGEKNWSLDVVSREMEVLRQYRLGFAFFRSKFFTDNIKGIYDFTLTHNARLALVPPMTWEKSTHPDTPCNLTITSSNRLSWQHDARGEDIYYNVYAGKTYPVNTDDGSNLIAMRLSGRQITVPAETSYYYAVTATNRYGIESTAAQMSQPTAVASAQPSDLLICDGKNLILPASETAWNRNLVVLICDLKGKTVATHLYNATTIDISRLSDGIYQLFSLTPRGTRHRHGYFIIRRPGMAESSKKPCA